MSQRFHVYVHASELLTGKGIRSNDGRRPQEEHLGRIEDGALVISLKPSAAKSKKWIPHRVEWVGPSSKLPKRFFRAPQTNLKKQKALLPGWIDAHTHLVFAGDRSSEFARRCAGATYEEIAASGGGILTTVSATRAATPSQLFKLANQRVKAAAALGTRVFEIKSGYGLSHEDEIKCLQVVERLRTQFPSYTFVSTYLGAHAFPREQSREAYLNEMIQRTLPEIASKNLAHNVDVFIDRGYFSIEEGRRILSKAKSFGLSVRVHADELSNTESTSLAVELGAQSADHLLKISKKGIEALARSNTTAVLLPGTAHYLKAPYAPARALIDAGARVAIATDFNPGSCMSLSIPTMLHLAALGMGMSRSELFAAVTYNAACALGLQNKKGSLEVGKDADFQVLPFERFEEIYYRF